MDNRQYGCGPMTWRQQSGYSAAPVNITETEEAYVVSLYAPALRKEALSITTQNDILTISYKGEKDTATTYKRREYRPEEIHRMFDLKGKVEIDNIRASYNDGVLKVKLPKTDAARRSAQEVRVQ